MNQRYNNRRVLTESLCKLKTQLSYLPVACQLLWNATGHWTTTWIALLAAQGLLPVATVYLTRALVDRIVGAIQANGSWEATKPALILVSLMAGLMLLSELLSGITRWVHTAQSELARDHISGLIQEKSATVDLEFYDSADFYDHLHRARSEATSRPTALLGNVGGLFQSGITFAAMLFVLLPFGVWVPVALVVSTLPAFYVVLRHSLHQHHWHLKATPRERQAWYFDWLLTASDNAAELRLFGLANRFRDTFSNIRGALRTEKLELEKTQALAQVGAGLAGLSVTAGTMVWVVWETLHGSLSLGNLALFYQAFNQGQRMMRALLDNAGQIYYNMLFLGNLFDFLSLRSKIADPLNPAPVPASSSRGLSFEQVTFRYPGNDRTIFDGLNLRVPAGQIAAIVGRNGCGKSTLIKLICRFYDPNEGRITFDGIDLKELPVGFLRESITVLFQEPVHYQRSAAENILLGDPRIVRTSPQLQRAAQAAGADAIIGRLPHGFETILGRWFGGVELSVGEWQRLALARAFLRQSPIILLDEPTSAMDSWSELDWMRRFRELAEARTAIIVTHRFTTAMQADIIHVMEAGRVVESGSHADLLSRDGIYAASWQAQMQSKGEVERP